jgi:hypothetical protein
MPLRLCSARPPGGGYAWAGSAFLNPTSDADRQVNAWIADEAYNYCDGWYSRFA